MNRHKWLLKWPPTCWDATWFNETQTWVSNHNFYCWNSHATIEKHVGRWKSQADCWNSKSSVKKQFFSLRGCFDNWNSTLTVERQTWQMTPNSISQRPAWLLKFQCDCRKANLCLEALIQLLNINCDYWKTQCDGQIETTGGQIYPLKRKSKCQKCNAMT